MTTLDPAVFAAASTAGTLAACGAVIAMGLGLGKLLRFWRHH